MESSSSPRRPESAGLFDQAKAVIPGGVNSPVRAFRATGGTPVFFDRGEGAALFGADGERYVDCVGSWGPMIVGHAHPEVLRAVIEAARHGTSFGAPTRGEVAMAERLRDLVPSMEMSRLVSSGTEATMGALRLARGVTGRDLIVKCAGAYHGGADYLLVSAGSGAATLGQPDSAGVPKAIAGTTLVIPHNDLAAASEVFRAYPEQIAAMIVEPVAGNMGCVPPCAGWLEELRALTTAHGALLVFDEVMTGFRVALGGAQARYRVTPDLTCLGKIVGGGLPLGAYGGPERIMRAVAPLGPVYQAGTLSGNPVAVAAGRATLALLDKEGVYEQLETTGARVEEALRKAAEKAGVPCTVQRVGSMLTAFFQANPVRNYEEARQSATERFGRWHGALLDRGVYWPPSQFEAAFLSLAHDGATVDALGRAFEGAFADVSD